MPAVDRRAARRPSSSSIRAACSTGYRTRLNQSDLARLGAADETALLWLAIVTVGDEGMFANLRAPVVINPARMLGFQLVPSDSLYPLRHPLFVGLGGVPVLVFTRKRNDAIIIGDGIEVRVLRIGRDSIRLGVKAPPSVPVHRLEIYEQICEANRQAAALRDLPEPRRPPAPQVHGAGSMSELQSRGLAPGVRRKSSRASSSRNGSAGSTHLHWDPEAGARPARAIAAAGPGRRADRPRRRGPARRLDPLPPQQPPPADRRAGRRVGRGHAATARRSPPHAGSRSRRATCCASRSRPRRPSKARWRGVGSRSRGICYLQRALAPATAAAPPASPLSVAPAGVDRRRRRRHGAPAGAGLRRRSTARRHSRRAARSRSGRTTSRRSSRRRAAAASCPTASVVGAAPGRRPPARPGADDRAAARHGARRADCRRSGLPPPRLSPRPSSRRPAAAPPPPASGG